MKGSMKVSYDDQDMWRGWREMNKERVKIVCQVIKDMNSGMLNNEVSIGQQQQYFKEVENDCLGMKTVKNECETFTKGEV